MTFQKRAVLWSTLFSSVAFSATVKPAPRSMMVRGTEIALPFEVRILIDKIDVGQSLEFSGRQMRDDRGSLAGDDPVHCSVHRKFALAMNLLAASPVDADALWVCRGQDFERGVVDGARFEASSGFIKINREFYRHGIELIPQDNQLLVVNTVGIEEYLAGVINREIRSNYPAEAVKAQVIAARSYALATAADRRRTGQPFDLYGTIQDQVYKGAALEDDSSFKYVRDTRGQVLVHRDEILKAYYHASSGGYSELPQFVWGENTIDFDKLAYLARGSELDESLAESKWNINLSPQMGSLWEGIGRITDIHILQRSPGHRVLSLQLIGSQGMETLSGSDFRKKMGANWVKSTYFYVKRLEKGWRLEGRGHGHGVGLSQLGARALAKSGKSADEILNFYYPYSNLRKLNLDEKPPIIRIGTR